MAETPTRISYQPTDGLSYDTADPVYWDTTGLEQEIERTFEICHGCRMCFKFCDSFPSLFSIIDHTHDGHVGKITEEETARVFGDCFQCKLCEVQCPYTPREGHEYKLDFPQLVHRYNAVKNRGRKLPLAKRALADPDGTAKKVRMSLGLANKLNKVRLHRWFLEKVLGVHRDKLLPEFVGTTFEKWAQNEALLRDEPGGEAVLFQTCYVQHNEPQIGRDTVEVFARNSFDLRCASGLKCCSMPAWEQGDLETVRKNAKANYDILEPYVDAGAKVVVVNPTCSMMLRRELPKLVDTDDRARAEKIGAAVRDTGEALWEIRNEDRFDTDFKSSPGEKIAYHAPCHLRAQAAGLRGRDLLKKIPGVKVDATLECCGHDGTFAMTVEGFEPSQRIGKKAFDGMQHAEAKIWATECPLAALQFEQHAGTKAMHPMSILARAYREDGFSTKIDTETEPSGKPDPGEASA